MCLSTGRTGQTAVVYTRQELLNIGHFSTYGIRHDIPRELLKRRHRGTRAGVKRNKRRLARTWRATFKPAVPSITMGNVRCLTNKLDELETLIRNQKEYRESSLVCLTETWLTDNTSDSLISFAGFRTIRADRDTRASGKQKGGGLILLVNNNWCNPNHATIKERICNEDIELLAVSLRPYYLPREFSVVVAIVVYIPPLANAEIACDVIHTTIAGLESKYPEAFIAVSGDCNHVSLSKTLPTFKQFVNCTTRGDKTLDLLYANVQNAYKCTALPPLGRSDHDMIHLSSSYIPTVKRLPVITRTSRGWCPEAEEALRCCFEITEWDVFCEEYGEDIDGLVECITQYIILSSVMTLSCHPR